MEENNNNKNDIQEIKSIMERSTRFLSLSGLSGVFAGIIALIGAGFAYFTMNQKPYIYSSDYTSSPICWTYNNYYLTKMDIQLIAIAVLTMLFAVLVGGIFTSRKAKKANEKIWTRTFKRMLFHIIVPLITGGIFCLFLIIHRISELVAPATLIFYGLALLNGSKYTVGDIRNLGLIQLFLGLIACYFYGNGFIFWVIGFGFMHIAYGIIMYFKYETINKQAKQ